MRVTAEKQCAEAGSRSRCEKKKGELHCASIKPITKKLWSGMMTLAKNARKQ